MAVLLWSLNVSQGIHIVHCMLPDFNIFILVDVLNPQIKQPFDTQLANPFHGVLLIILIGPWFLCSFLDFL
uniref:Uncharacterized protein n=1 Tax=Lutzomyia longipalpis TaxID=7200 RepID=A0A7G3B641_LUTLO